MKNLPKTKTSEQELYLNTQLLSNHFKYSCFAHKPEFGGFKKDDCLIALTCICIYACIGNFFIFLLGHGSVMHLHLKLHYQ